MIGEDLSYFDWRASVTGDAEGRNGLRIVRMVAGSNCCVQDGKVIRSRSWLHAPER